MVKFSRYIVAKFFELLPKNPVLLAELVVWKSAGDCYEIVEGYGSLALRYEKISGNNRGYTEHKSGSEIAFIPFVYFLRSLALKKKTG